MDSTSATRLWRIHSQANRSWPVLDDDEVIDYMIMEAVALRVNKEDREDEKKQQVADWKKDDEGLDNLRNITR